MHIVFVHVHVKGEFLEEFYQATLVNAQSSIQEPGVVRFDIVQQNDDPNRYVLIEIYRDETASASHKQTPHYLLWRETVAPFMAEPRKGIAYRNVYPADLDW